MFLPRKILEAKLQGILAEDVGEGDITTALIVPAETKAEAKVVVKESGIVAGMEEAKILSESQGLTVDALVVDGEKIKAKQVIMKISGDARTILSVERTLLNIISRMSGIATATRELKERLQKRGFKTRIACTRKTAPGLLYFDKKAVFIGDGDTHRLHLDDMILIKDNHITVIGSAKKAIEKAKEKASFTKKIEVETARTDDVLEAATAGVDIIMLDNFSPKQVEKAVKLLKKEGLREKILFEASGGITQENILAFASTGVDVVSLGEITANAKFLDMSLELNRT